MSEEMKGTTRYLDATVMEYALLDHARLRTPYGTQDDVRAPGAVRCSYADEWSEGASSGVLAEAADFERDVESLAASGDGPDGDEDPFASYYGGARPTTRGGR